MVKLLIGVVIAAFIVIIGFMAIDPNLNNNIPGTNLTEPDNVYSLSIEGEIEKPGTYVLQEGAIMSDLIETAGGLTSNADERGFFETAVLTKGMSYYIPPLYDKTDICATDAIVKVNINVDSAETLMTINGFTSSIATSIVSHRNENGEFKTIEQLEDVYGIGPATYKKVRDYVILHE